MEFMKLSDWLELHVRDIDLKDCKRVIDAYTSWRNIMIDGNLGHPKRCAICRKELTVQEEYMTTPYDFNYCCKEHIQYKNHFQLNVVREKLGIIEQNPFEILK